MKPARPFGFPTILQLEPTSECNLRCKICPSGTGMDRPSGHMDLNVFKKIIDEIGQYLFLILFWDWGEPFLNPEAYAMIEVAHQRGIKIMSSTNGHIFADYEQARKVTLSGLDVLVFSGQLENFFAKFLYFTFYAIEAFIRQSQNQARDISLVWLGNL